MLTLLGTIAAFALADHLRRTWRDLSGALRSVLVVVILALLAVAVVDLRSFALAERAVARMLMPAGLLWCGIVGAVLLSIGARSRGAFAATFAALALYTIAGNGWIGGALTATLEGDYAEIDPLDAEPMDAVIVLGGGAQITDDGRAILGSSGDRVVTGARVYHAGLTPILVTSGSSLPGTSVVTDASEATTTIWTGLAVPESAIVRIPAPYNTSRELEELAILIDELGWQRVGIVTSAWHMRRALRLAAAHDLTLVPLPADVRGTRRWDGFVSVVPTGPGFESVHRACWEYLGAALGR